MPDESYDLLCPKCYKPAKVRRTMRAGLDVTTGRQPCCRLCACSACGHTFLRYEDTISADNRLDIAGLKPSNGNATKFPVTSTREPTLTLDEALARVGAAPQEDEWSPEDDRDENGEYKYEP